MPSAFSIRPASSALEDGKRILAYTDSQIPWLAAHGASGQWGTEPLGHDAGRQQRYAAIVLRSEMDSSSFFTPDWARVYIAEVERPSQANLSVAGMVLESHAGDYVKAVLPSQDEQDPFLYVRFLATDRTLGHVSRGSGAALLEHAKKVASTLGIRRLCLDCWRGNDRKLVKYYERLGWICLGDVPDDGPRDWPSAVLELRI